MPTKKTISEELFERYLNDSGSSFRFQPRQEGTAKLPDYSMKVSNTEILFEVKQFDQTSGGVNLPRGAYDPYRPVREKINQAREKFKSLSRSCCCLVLYNNARPLIRLGCQFIYGAMLGNLGFSTPVNEETGMADESRTEAKFMGGGKMYRYVPNQRPVPQNRTISAILVLQRYMVGARRLEMAIEGKEKQLGPKVGRLEYLNEIEFARATGLDPSVSQLRVVVHENPFSRIPLPRELFRGPYDERYAGCAGRIVRVFCGSQLSALEEARKLA